MAKSYDSQEKLAKRLGVNQQRVSQLVNDPDWSHGRGPWTEVDAKRIEKELVERRSTNNRTAGDSDDDDAESTVRSITKNPEKIARIRLLISRDAKIKAETAILTGDWVKREDVKTQNIAKALSLRGKTQEIPLRAALIAGKTEIECERVLIEWMKEICELYPTVGNQPTKITAD